MRECEKRRDDDAGAIRAKPSDAQFARYGRCEMGHERRARRDIFGRSHGDSLEGRPAPDVLVRVDDLPGGLLDMQQNIQSGVTGVHHCRQGKSPEEGREDMPLAARPMQTVVGWCVPIPQSGDAGGARSAPPGLQCSRPLVTWADLEYSIGQWFAPTPEFHTTGLALGVARLGE